MELNIDGKVYTFRFGIGFLREIDGQQTLKSEQGVKQSAGFAIVVAGIMDGNIIDLINALMVANRTEEPRIEQKALEKYLEDEDTDIDKIFRDTIDFLSKSNACKNKMKNIQDLITQTAGEDAIIRYPVK